MKGNRPRLDFSVLHSVDFVTAEHGGDSFADTFDVTVPVGDVFVGYAGSDVEHDDGAVGRDTALG